MTRRGLVLGAGGVLGFTWAVGALTAIEQEEGFDCRDVEMIVGTSAGSITAALLGCGTNGGYQPPATRPSLMTTTPSTPVRYRRGRRSVSAHQA